MNGIEPVVMWSFEDACKALNEEPKRIREILKHTPIAFEDVTEICIFSKKRKRYVVGFEKVKLENGYKFYIIFYF